MSPNLLIMQFGWTIVMFVCQAWVGTRYRDRVGKGRILSRPLWRFRFFSPRVYVWGDGHFFILYSFTRVRQMLVMVVLTLTLVVLAFFGASVGSWDGIGFSGVTIALYLDDYVTGNDDSWQRFREWVKGLTRRLRLVPTS